MKGIILITIHLLAYFGIVAIYAGDVYMEWENNKVFDLHSVELMICYLLLFITTVITISMHNK